VDSVPVRSILRAIATTIVPETSSLDERAWLEVEAVIARAVSSRSPRLARQIVKFLSLIQALPVIRYGRRFTSLNPRQRASFLASLERSRLLVLRRGFWGIRSLIFMGYYTREDVAESIGYRAVAGGWAARGGTVSTIPLAPTLWVEP
jgi:gluconate 2-dehydrogenase subunit 3-like protein